MRSCLTFFFLFTAVFLHGQDLTGIWQGHFRSGNQARSLLYDDRYKFEVQIAQHNKSFQAITYSYLSSVFYGKAEAAGAVNPRTGKVILQEGKLVEIRMQNDGGACVMTCFLQYSRSGDEEFLEGSFGSMNIQDSTNCGRGTIFLRKVSNSDFYKEPFVEKREKEIVAERTAVAKNKKAGPGATKGNPGATKGGPATTKIGAPALAKSPSGNSTDNRTKPSTEAATKKTPGLVVARPDSLKRIAAARPSVPKNPVAPHPETHPRTNDTHPAAPPPARVGIAGVPQTKAGNDSDLNAPPVAMPQVIPEVLANRSNELVKTITVNTNEVTLNIYDDGAIDNDTISVFLDKKAVISHAMLTDRPIIVTLHLDESHSVHEVVMVADNEGTIPPNTSLMIVKAGDKQYEVRITSTEQKNAVVIFKYEKAK